MKHPFKSTLASVIALLAASGLAAAQPYAVIDLGPNRTLNSVNDLGQVVGTETYAKSGRTPQTTRGFVWSNGVKRDLGVLTGGTFSNARAINGSGQVVGYANVPVTGNTWRAFVWHTTTGMRNLNDVAGADGTTAASQGWILHTAFGINEHGQIVGWGERTDEPAWPNAYLWERDSAGNVHVKRLPLGTRYAEAETRGINESGQIVSSVANEVPEPPPSNLITDLPMAAAWQRSSETTTPLGLLGLDGLESHAYSINNSSEAVGYAWGGYKRAVYWNSTTTGPTDLGTLGGTDSTAFEISESGHVVGWAHISSGTRRAFVWDDLNGMRNLNALSNVGSTWILQTATAISPNTGFIVGNGTLKVKTSLQARAFLLKP